MDTFYSDVKGYEQSPVPGTSLADVDENALNRYRTLRSKVNPTAEELSYSDEELLEALGCVSKHNKKELNLAGLILFGSSRALRAHLPMQRVDYIRVPGNEWVPDPDDRFTTIDMRGPLLTLVYRLVEAVNNDLPKGFLLPEGELQAESVGLPMKALREAIVNAVMHRSYREHRPVQVIRYDNRIEIINPGFSLKSEEKLGEPGSELRNPFIATVFHETNLAETKGSGIRSMRKLMKEANMAPPTFESDRSNNQFTSRLLLHHMLDEYDIQWLSRFSGFQLNDGQKMALIFVREVGAVDNKSYRQMADCDTLRASQELRVLKSHGLLSAKGRGRATYYVPGERLIQEISTPPQQISAPPQGLNTHGEALNTQGEGLNTHGEGGLSAPPQQISTPPQQISTPPQQISTPPQSIINRIEALKQRVHKAEKIREIIIDLCSVRPMKASELAAYLDKGEAYIKRKYLRDMIAKGELKYTYPEMINHPNQAYTVPKT